MCDTKYCSNCDKPVAAGVKLTKGECPTCYSYRRRKGQPRPILSRHPAKPGRCQNCYRDISMYAMTKQLCDACERHERLYNCPRPLKQSYCWNCGREKAGKRSGLCVGCNNYRRTTGKDRPEHLYSKGGYCRNCARGKAQIRGLCPACYEYQRANGRRRPPHRWADYCMDCGRPRNNGMKFTRGSCLTCYNYRHRYGTLSAHKRRERRERLAPFGWCECGKKAVTVTQVQAGAYTETFPLCESCAREAA